MLKQHQIRGFSFLEHKTFKIHTSLLHLQPILWEWIWLASVLFTYFGLTACKKSNASSMTIFIYGVLLTGLLPVLFALAYHAKDVFSYVSSSKSLKGVQSWQGFPVSLLWYAFLVLAFQVRLHNIICLLS